MSEGRATSIPTIQEELRKNGSLPARIETDDARSYFLIEIPNWECFKNTIESIEKERVALYERYVKQKRISNIIMLITVVLVIGCFILISQQNPALMITGYVLAGLVIVGMIVYYVLTRNKLPDATKTYIKFITTRFNICKFW